MSKPSDNLIDSEVTFSDAPFSSLDPRVLKALADLQFAHPTLVQATAIPLLLDGKDVLARARTGSGKTGAYCVPIVQKVLDAKAKVSPAAADYQVTRAVILVPTRELSLQVASFLKSLMKYSDEVIQAVNIAAGGANLQRVLLNDNPDILISTPSRLLTLLQSKTVDLAHLSFLAIDEADLLLSYGHKEDLERIMDAANGFVPRLGVQGCLVSATLSEDVESVKGLVLRNPAILTLSEPEASSFLTQHFTYTTEKDKFLLIYVLLKLKLIRGKSIVFVNDIERGYRLKLFLGQFGIKTCVVNSELPLASRYHVVEEFNRGVYDVVVATDEGAGEYAEVPEGPGADAKVEGDAEGVKAEGAEAETAAEAIESAEASTITTTNAEAGPSKRPGNGNGSSKRKRRADPASSMARGIDFTNASSVINFDLPTSTTAYAHRVGRTARAGRSGLALSFVVKKDSLGKERDRTVMIKSAQRDEEVWSRIAKKAEQEGSEMKEWDWAGRKSEIEGFRYRMEDALRAVTGKRVQEARRDEVKRELLNSEKLKAHFAANPLDLEYLRHDTISHPARQQSHLKHVPSYLMPKVAAQPLSGSSGDVGEGAHIPFHKKPRGNGHARGGRGGGRGGRGGRGGKKADPLKLRG